MSFVHLVHLWDDYWDEGHKVTFNGELKRVFIAKDVTEIDVKRELYSDWKEWVTLYDNTKWSQAMRSAGGDPTPIGALGSAFFMVNDWKIVIDHGVNFIGDLFADDGSSPFITERGQQLSQSTVSTLPVAVKPADSVVENIATTVVSEIDIPTSDQNADAVWNKDIANINITSSIGYYIHKKVLTIAKFLGLK